MKIIIAGIAALAAGGSALAQQAPAAQQVWRSDNADRPEAVHVPAGSDWAYIGNQSGEGEAFDEPGVGFLSRLNLATGEFQARWVANFDGPLGISSDATRLFMVDNGERIVVLDRATGERLETWETPDEAGFLNDVAVDNEGRVWVTDTRAGALYMIDDGEWERLYHMGPFTGANGVEYVDDWIYVVCSSGVGNLIRIDPMTFEMDVLLEGQGSLDGVITDGRGGLILSDIGGRLLHWSHHTGVTVLDDFADEEIMLNSIGGTADGQWVFVPHWRQSQLSAFRVDYPEG